MLASGQHGETLLGGEGVLPQQHDGGGGRGQQSLGSFCTYDPLSYQEPTHTMCTSFPPASPFPELLGRTCVPDPLQPTQREGK